MAGAPQGTRRPAVRSTSPASVEWKKALDRYAGIPLLHLHHLASRLTAPLRRPRPAREVRSILLVKLWGIGNLAMVLPYVRALRERFPGAWIGFLTLERNRPLVAQHPLVDQVFTLRDRGLMRPWLDLARITTQLRRRRVDLFLDFEQFLRIPGLISRWIGAGQAIGFRTAGQHRDRLHHAQVPYDPTRHMAEVFGDVVRAAGVNTDGLPPLEVPRFPAAARRLKDKLPHDIPRPWLVLHPGSGDNFPGRRWPAARFRECGRRLRTRYGGTILLTGAAAESELTAGVAAGLLPLPSHPTEAVGALDLAGRLDLEELVELLAGAELVVSNDTGPVHLAAALGAPVVALYGPNTPQLYGPLGTATRAIYHPLPCSPCLTNLNAKTSPCQRPACIESIEVDEVLATAGELLARRVPVLPRAAAPQPSGRSA